MNAIDFDFKIKSGLHENVKELKYKEDLDNVLRMAEEYGCEEAVAIGETIETYCAFEFGDFLKMIEFLMVIYKKYPNRIANISINSID